MNFLKALTFLAQLHLAIALALQDSTVSLAMTPVQSHRPELVADKANLPTANKQAVGQVPGRRRGGARRGDCPETSVPLTALVPAQDAIDQALPVAYVGGVTIAERPTFWFYVPYQLDANLIAEFILQDAGQEIYRVASTEFPAAETSPGIISVTLPNSIPSLEIGKTYQWFFKVNCARESPPFVRGGVQRVVLNPAVASQLAAASPQEQVAIYQANNFWYDAITTIGTLQRAEGKAQADWTSLLEAIGLEDIPVDQIAP